MKRAWLALLLALWAGCSDDSHPVAVPSTPSTAASATQAGQGEVVVYCAHDQAYSQAILQRFSRETGIATRAKFDTELTKSLSLVQAIMEERDQPRCDLFWNNEPLGTMDLAQEGLLEPYQGPGWRRMPEAYKDPAGRWTGFAARLRVWIVNTDKVAADYTAIAPLVEGDDLSRFTLAKPLFGTTRGHYTALWRLWGPEALKRWHERSRAAGLVEARSNGQTRSLVAQGQCEVGWTDTDDFFEAKNEGRPVAMLPVRLVVGTAAAHEEPAITLPNETYMLPDDPSAGNEGPTICLPNTVALIKGSANPEAARRLADWLLSAQTELLLAQGPARQIPLGPVADAQALPAEVLEWLPLAAQGYSLQELDQARQPCLQWLQTEYTQ